RSGDGQRINTPPVDKRKERVVSSVSQRQRQNRNRREPPVLCQHPQSVHDVLPEVFHGTPPPRPCAASSARSPLGTRLPCALFPTAEASAPGSSWRATFATKSARINSFGTRCLCGNP